MGQRQSFQGVTEAELKTVSDFREGEYNDVIAAARILSATIEDAELDLQVGDQSMVEVLAIHAQLSHLLYERMMASFFKQTPSGKMW